MTKSLGLLLTATASGAVAGFLVAAGADLTSWQAEEWSALAAWVTAAVAVIAGLVAVRQLGEARRLRLEQAQPYVVAYMEPSSVDPQFVDLVIRNFGTTAATDVTMTMTPAPRRSSASGGDTEEVWVPESIPLLVPGQAWRTLWDYSVHRKDTDLPDRYLAAVLYRDTHGRPFEAPAVLDWGAYKGRRWVTAYGMHDAAKALREMQKSMRKWQEGVHGGLAVFVRDGDAKDEARRRDLERAKQQHEELLQRMRGSKEEAANEE